MKNLHPQKLTKKIAGTELEYLFYEGDGPPVFFLHATGFMPWLWHPVARRLCADYTIIAPYFCDHREIEPEEGGGSTGTFWRMISITFVQFLR